MVSSLSSNADEAALIKHHLEHSVKLSGNLEEDISNAKLLANKKKILQTNSELAHSLRAKSLRETKPFVSGAKSQSPSTPPLSDHDKQAVKGLQAWKKRRGI